GKVIVAEDHVESQLDIPPTMPKEEIAQRLKAELTKRGFDETEDGKLLRERGGVKVQVDPATRKGRGSLEAEKQLPPPPDPPPRTCRAIDALRKEQAEQSSLQREVTERLAGAVGRLGCELEGVAARITKDAIKDRARQLGRIKMEHEDPKTGELVIVVEVGA